MAYQQPYNLDSQSESSDMDSVNFQRTCPERRPSKVKNLIGMFETNQPQPSTSQQVRVNVSRKTPSFNPVQKPTQVQQTRPAKTPQIEQVLQHTQASYSRQTEDPIQQMYNSQILNLSKKLQAQLILLRAKDDEIQLLRTRKANNVCINPENLTKFSRNLDAAENLHENTGKLNRRFKNDPTRIPRIDLQSAEHPENQTDYIDISKLTPYPRDYYRHRVQKFKKGPQPLLKSSASDREPQAFEEKLNSLTGRILKMNKQIQLRDMEIKRWKSMKARMESLQGSYQQQVEPKDVATVAKQLLAKIKEEWNIYIRDRKHDLVVKRINEVRKMFGYCLTQLKFYNDKNFSVSEILKIMVALEVG